MGRLPLNKSKQSNCNIYRIIWIVFFPFSHKPNELIHFCSLYILLDTKYYNHT